MTRRLPQQLLSLPEGAGPLYLKLYHRIRTLILNGSWPTGTQLPSTRRLAEDLGISRNTAILAYDQLVADGWIVARTGSGVYVSDEAPPVRPVPRASVENDDRSTVRPPVAFEMAPPAVDIFPVDQWARLQSRVWRQAPGIALHEGSGAGWRPLRCAIAAHLHAVRGLDCDPDRVIVLPSTQAAIDLALRVLSRPEDRMWVENPGYPYARQAVRAARLQEVPLPVDRHGIQVELGLETAPDARLAYVIPGCQFPTGAVLSDERRSRLLEWAAERQSFVLEDDWDYNAYFQVLHPPLPLAARAPDRVLFIHSFNRLMFPGLRIAALIVPESLVSNMVEARQAIDGFTNVANQIALTEFMQRGFLAAHLRASRVAHLERRAALHRALASRGEQWFQLDPLQAGLHTVAHVPGRDDSALAACARRAGLACSAISDFMTGDAKIDPALLLGFAAHSPQSLVEGVDRLLECFAASPQLGGLRDQQAGLDR